jgi:RNA polymerase sigma-70 factor (ECF subfamily)
MEFNLQKVNDVAGPTEQTGIIRIGDEAAFEQIFRQYHQQLCRYAFTILKDAEAAEEMVQDVFLKIWERKENLEITVSIKSYLYRAVHNSCLNLSDKKKKEVRMDEAPLKIVHPSANPAENIQTRELEKAIAAGLNQLPAECRKVFEMSRFGEMKYREIADALGISVKTVENQMGKALRIMRAQLAEYLPVLFPFIVYQLFQCISVL